jgi:arginyl-tRNA synthetase
MGLEEQLRGHIEDALDALASAGELDAALVQGARFNVEPPRRGGSGDLASNVALVLGKPAKKNPRELAERIAERLRELPEVRQVEVAGPGFLNVGFHPPAFHRVLDEVLGAGRAYGRAPAATGERVNVEFVSANPTGPLLVSHGRGAVVGDAVARLLEATGHRVTREYYINDFGNQVRLLAHSVRAAGAGKPPPEGGYGGGYVTELATAIQSHHPELLEPDAEGKLMRQCVTLMLDGMPGSELAGIRPILRRMGIEFDVWTSEESLHRWGRVGRTLAELDAKGRLSKTDDGATVFVTGDEDEKDRVVRKRDGNFTYFASDIAYHDDKIARGFERMIDVWGADHHGYIARMKSAIEALGHDAERFEVLLFQLVSLMRDGKPYRMGKRLGNLITLQEVIDEIDEAVGNPHAGRDALRFFYLSRRVDTPIVLDIELAKKQESENPVFYIQYGHARLCSIQRRARGKLGLGTPRYSPGLAARVEHPLELRLIAELGRYPGVLAEAALGRDPHRVVFYLQGIAQAFQSYYTQLRTEKDAILPTARQMAEPGWEAHWDRDKTLGRLLWVDAIRTVYRSGLELLGLEAPERMTREPEDEEEPPG